MTLESLRARSPFSILNIVALVAIIIIGYFLYKKFTKKFKAGAIRMPSFRPSPAPAPARKVSFKKPVIVESESESDEEEDVPESSVVEEDVPDVTIKEE